MATTLLNYREAIRVDYQLEGDPNFPATFLALLINQAQRFVQIQLMGLGLKKWEKSMIVTGSSIVSGAFAGQAVKQFLLALLTNLAESPKAIRFIEVSDGTNYGLAYEVDEKFAYEHLNNSLLSPTIRDAFFSRMDNNVILTPSTVTSSTVHYYGVVTDLVNDGDISEIPIEFTESVIKRVGIEVDFIRKRIQDKQAAIDELTKAISNVYQQYLEKTQIKDQDNKASLQ